MLKNYARHYPTGNSTVPSRYAVRTDLSDVDERLDRLEKLVRAHVLEPAGVEVGAPISVACDRVSTHALADEIPARGPYPRSTADKERLIDELRRRTCYLEGKLNGAKADLTRARLDANFAKDALYKYRTEVETKVRQLATSLSKS